MDSEHESDSEAMATQLRFLQADYIDAHDDRRPMKRFYCPIMAVDDEDAELCLGHVINASIKNCCRARVVQRKDVDGFYGKLFERDFIALVEARSRPKNDLLLDPKLRKKMKFQIKINGVPCDYYEDRGGVIPPNHTAKTIVHPDGGELKIVVKKSPEELNAAPQKWTILVDMDHRVAALGSLIKSAYLTLFRLLGYRYATSAAGYAVGHDILGDFFRKHRHMSTVEASEAAADYFQPYINMVRSIDNYDGVTKSGTIETGQGLLCSTPDDKFIGMIINVRTDNILTAVLMPAFNSDKDVPTYLDFMKNDNENVLLRHCRFSEKGKTCTAEKNGFLDKWPKKDWSLDLNSTPNGEKH
jgi:hypothetical protein